MREGPSYPHIRAATAAVSNIKRGEGANIPGQSGAVAHHAVHLRHYLQSSGGADNI